MSRKIVIPNAEPIDVDELRQKAKNILALYTYKIGKLRGEAKRLMECRRKEMEELLNAWTAGMITEQSVWNVNFALGEVQAYIRSDAQALIAYFKMKGRTYDA